MKFPVYYSNVPKKTAKNRAPLGIVPINKRRILLVEDEQDIAELVTLHLSGVCDEIIVASDGYEGMRLATSSDWSLIILDLRLPGPDGLEICRAVRRERAYQPC